MDAKLREQRRALYRAGRYKFKAPPVPTQLWDENDWINYITACNGWLPEE